MLSTKLTIYQKLRIARKKTRQHKNSYQNNAHLSIKKNHLGKKLWFFLTQKLLKVTIFQKLKITQKILFMQKMSPELIPIYSANLATFEKSDHI